jgi:AmiR/NasT family two-component response regulator
MKKNGIILGIENAILALDLENLIRREGLGDTVICYSCKEVYTTLDSIIPELVVIDIPFDNKNQWLELIRYFMEHSPAPVIAITDSYCSQLHEEIFGAGAVYILTKPLDRNILYSSLADIFKT